MALKTPLEAQKEASKLFPSGLKVKGNQSVQIPGNVVSSVEAAKRAETLFPANLKQVVPQPKKFQLSTTKNVFESQVETVTATGGTRTLTFDGQTTAAIAYNASAGTIQTALEALSNIASGDVIVSQTVSGGVYRNVYSFAGAYANLNVKTLVVGTGSLTGGSASVVVDAESMQAIVAREQTRAELKKLGLLRPYDQPVNDIEKANRVPKDIGNPERTPGEDY